MKALTELDNIDKAALLHELFPEEIPALLEFALNLAITIQEDGPINIWNKGMLHADISTDILATIIQSIQVERKALERRARVFADHLFDGFRSLFTMYCIEQYITVRQHDNKKFSQCCHIFFEM